MADNSITNKSFLAADLFAGAGGFSLSAQNLGIQIAAAVEFDKHAACTYRKNFIEGRDAPPILFEENISSLTPGRFMKETGLEKGDLDIIMGGPPCQGFSSHRIKDAGVDDERNKLLIRYFKFVSALRPKMFILENVPGLLWPRHKPYLDEFFRQANSNKYKVFDPLILNAQDFGVPQNRKRVFIVGVAMEYEGHLVWPPSKSHSSPKACEEDNDLMPWLTAGNVFKVKPPKGDPNNIHMNHTPELVEVFRNTPSNGGSRYESGRTLKCHENYVGHRDVYGRINSRVPGPTMTTGCVNPSKGRFVHPTKNHGITVRHAARFQTFPDDFVFEGGLTAAGKQIGNAVPVKLGEAVLLPLIESLSNRANLAKSPHDKQIAAE